MPTKTFIKNERLLKSTEFLKVRKNGKKISLGAVILYVLKNDLGTRRLGLSAGKYLGNAVERNLTKRILREFFRTNKDIFPESSDTLVVVKKCVKNLDEISTIFLERKPFKKQRANKN